MTAATSDVAERLDALVGLFNRGSLDLPEALLDRNARFLLNGVSYEETLGRSPDDPLVRLVARGAAAFRFLAQALRYALPDARVMLHTLTRSASADGFALAGSASLAGLPRGEHERLEAECPVAFTFDAEARLVAVAVEVDAVTLGRLRAARTR